MKFVVLFCLMFFTTLSVAADRQLGAGVMLGNPTGLSGKYWLSEKNAVDGGFAFTLGKNSALGIHSDYLWHSKGAFFFNDVHPLDLYYGVGGRMEFGDDINLGVRVPVGLAHTFAEQPVDVFAEFAPILNLISDVELDLHLAVGARYYFE